MLKLRPPVLLVSLQVMCAHCTLYHTGTQQPYAFWYCSFSFLCSSHRCSIFLIFFCLSSICFSFVCAYFFFLFSLSSSVIRLPLARDYTSTEIMLYSINENYMDADKRDDAFPQTHTNAGREIDKMEYSWVWLLKRNTYARFSSSTMNDDIHCVHVLGLSGMRFSVLLLDL